jgi:AcrR family transcriptional regulator
VSRKAEQAEQTRRRLIKVATGLFAVRGYEDTPIEEVLRVAGVSKGALYHHFPNKEALFEAVFREQCARSMDHIKKAAVEATDPLDMLRSGCQAWLDMTMDPSVRRITLIDGPGVLGWQRWREIDQEHYVGLVKHALEAATEAGQIRAQNIDLMAHLACAMLGEAAMLIAQAQDPVAARQDAGLAVNRLIDAVTQPIL